MGLMFCPQCKTCIVPEKIGVDFFISCPNCNFSGKIKEGLKSSEKILQKDSLTEGVSSGENPLASYENVCQKCGYDKAQLIDVGILYSDEDNLILLKCGKCGFSERIGRKVS
jgi:DNA-directed RNA polymerase subunit M/transcription elongation factor TFIIS